jgi:hypothetical protein
MVVFVTEYVNVPFDEVCHVLEVAGERILGEVNRPLPRTTTERLTPGGGFDMVRETGHLTQSSRDVASLRMQWAGSPRFVPSEPAELRIIRVASGTAPLTELLGVVPSGVTISDARSFIERLATRLEQEILSRSVSEETVPEGPKSIQSQPVASGAAILTPRGPRSADAAAAKEGQSSP